MGKFKTGDKVRITGWRDLKVYTTHKNLIGQEGIIYDGRQHNNLKELQAITDTHNIYPVEVQILPNRTWEWFHADDLEPAGEENIYFNNLKKLVVQERGDKM